MSGLKINFSKSKLYGVNIDDNFMVAASSFLYCCVDSLPFKFLGLPVGSNPRRISTWSPVIDNMKKRLNVWKGRHLSIGGRVTLINSVLSSIPLYYLSFYRAPKKVIEELTRIQRQFLWGGSEGKNKINWVSWSNVCKPKSEGGLGLKNLEKFNCALLIKWKWRMLVEKESIWYDLLTHKYGHLT
jgi:hypothetical protein